MNERMILVINSGSSSVKMALVHHESGDLQSSVMTEYAGNVTATIHQMIMELLTIYRKDAVVAVGHRVVHGGERFIKPTRLNAAVIKEIEAISYLAPLHNPVNLQGICEAMAQLPNVPHVAVFDTAFHYAIPPYAYLYAVPYRWYERYGVRRYGFHGSSHQYVGRKAANILDRPFDQCHFLTVHLGNGCSATAIANGKSVDTTMGLTPLEGLVMGSRSGDVDPGLHQYMAKQTGQSLQAITKELNQQSGLLGLSGLSNDMRALLEAAENGSGRASLAIDVFCYRLAKSLAALTVALGALDAIVFTGGIGEHSCYVRKKTIEQLTMFGAEIDAMRNRVDGQNSDGFISSETSSLAVLVIATCEEKMIALDVASHLAAAPWKKT